MPRKRNAELHEGRVARYRVGDLMRQLAAEDGVTRGTASRSLTLAGVLERRGAGGGSPGTRTEDYPSPCDTLRRAFGDRSSHSRATRPSLLRLSDSPYTDACRGPFVPSRRRSRLTQSLRSLDSRFAHTLTSRNRVTFVVRRCSDDAASPPSVRRCAPW